MSVIDIIVCVLLFKIGKSISIETSYFRTPYPFACLFFVLCILITKVGPPSFIRSGYEISCIIDVLI